MVAMYCVQTAKAVEMILWLANARPNIDLYHVVKCAFFAEKSHLVEFGRPIIGDNYRADTYGPLGTTVYGLLRNDPMEMLALGGNGNLPFSVRPDWKIEPYREANARLLSRSDVAALQRALDFAGDMTFDELVDLTHDDPAYRAANGGRMKYEDMIDWDDPERELMIDDLAFSSRHAVL